MKHDASGAGSCGHVEGLNVLFVGPDIADVWKGERDDLASIGRVREDFLIAGHRGVKAHFAHRVTRGAEPKSFEHRSVCEHEQGGSLRFSPTRIARRRANFADASS